MREIARCTGHCCRSFFLPHTIEKIRQLKIDGMLHPENAMLVEMLVPIPVPAGREIGPGGSGSFYECSNYDAATGNCRVYETRPKMCRDYPYGRSCDYEGCTRKVEPDEVAVDVEKAVEV